MAREGFERGRVEHFNSQRRWGFIAQDDKQVLFFFSRRNIFGGRGMKDLCQGDLVEFIPYAGGPEELPEAKAVTLIEGSFVDRFVRLLNSKWAEPKAKEFKEIECS